MMNFLPQGYSFESRSNPYESQFISPFAGSGQYGYQYSPMAQGGPRLPTCQPGTCPPWLPPGLIATPSSGVQELSVLFDPSLAARMSRAYNSWTVAYWGKPDVPAWLWPDGSAPRPVPPNVFCEPAPGPGPQLTPGPSPGPQITPGPSPGPQITPGPSPRPQITPGPSPGPQITPGSVPKSSLTPGTTPSSPGMSSVPIPSSAQPNPARPWWFHRRQNPGVPSCHGAGNKAKCFRCCNENSTSKSERQKCLNQCVGLPEPPPTGAPGGGRITSPDPRRSRLARSAGRRAKKVSARVSTAPARPSFFR